jgi:anti-sigma regulatory factor (Ser/Thr protein kinase)
VPRTLQFLGDHDRVLQILANLLSNAVKFTEPGGEITIEVEQRAEAGDTVHLHGDGPWVLIRVRDNGIGIEPTHLETIFSPFVQAEVGHTRRSDGTGLGLTISRRLARLMRGDVTVESTPGNGSVFTLWVPGTTAADGQALVDAGSTAGTTSRTRGLADIGDTLMHEMEGILDAFVAQLRHEPLMPAAPTLRYSQLVDHTGAMLADIASALITLDESRGAPSSLLLDSADIQRFVADRHGLQRARLGWTIDALVREAEILRVEIERSVRRCYSDPKFAPQVDEALGVIRRYIEQGLETSRRALERVAHRGRRGED